MIELINPKVMFKFKQDCKVKSMYMRNYWTFGAIPEFNLPWCTEKGGTLTGRDQSETDRKRKAASAFVISRSKNTCSTVLLRQRLSHSIQKDKIHQISRYRQVSDTRPPNSRYSRVSAVPLLCIWQSSPDRNPPLQWGYILPQWIQAPVDSLETRPAQTAFRPARPDCWNLYQQASGAVESSVQMKAMVGWMWGQCWRIQRVAGCPVPLCTLAGKGRRGSATALTCRPSAGYVRSAAFLSHTPVITRQRGLVFRTGKY